MTYDSWFISHKDKHKAIINKLKANNASPEEIREYFLFDNMVLNEPEFCPLYKTNTKCHDMDNLSCFLCACPHFIYNDDGLHSDEEERTVYSECSINCSKGGKYVYGNTVHQDCSNCQIPHTERYVERAFDYDWGNIMRDCKQKTD